MQTITTKPNTHTRMTNPALWARDFDMRIENATRILQAFGKDTSITVENAIDIFTHAAGFQDDAAKNPRFLFHEIAHVIGSATSGTPADEGHAVIVEMVLNKGAFTAKNYKDKPLYGRAEHFQHATQEHIYQKIQQDMWPRIQSAIEYYQNKIDGLIDQITRLRLQKITMQDAFPQNLATKKAQLDQKIEALRRLQQHHNVLSKTLNQRFKRAVQQCGLFETITNGRPLYALSSNELRKMPISYFAVEYNQTAQHTGDLFVPTPTAEIQQMSRTIQESTQHLAPIAA